MCKVVVVLPLRDKDLGGRAALELEPQPLGSDVTPDLTNERARKLRIRKGQKMPTIRKGGY